MKLLLSCLPLLILLRAAAQEAPVIETELTTLSLQEPVRDLYFRSGGEVVEFRSVPGGIGLPVPYRGPARLALYPTREALADGAPPTEPAAVVDLPADADRVLMLTSKRPGNPLRIQALPVPFDDLKGGEYRFYNFSDREARILLGAESLVLPSGRSGTLSNSAWEEGSRDIHIKLGSQTEEGMKVYSSVWGHRATLRYFVFLFNGPEPDAPLVIRRVHDRAP